MIQHTISLYSRNVVLFTAIPNWQSPEFGNISIIKTNTTSVNTTSVGSIKKTNRVLKTLCLQSHDASSRENQTMQKQKSTIPWQRLKLLSHKITTIRIYKSMLRTLLKLLIQRSLGRKRKLLPYIVNSCPPADNVNTAFCFGTATTQHIHHHVSPFISN
jgi:hypothetical protein